MRVPAELKRLADDPFDGKLEYARVGSIEAIHTAHGSLRAEATPSLVRRHGLHDSVAVFLRLAGVAKTSQFDRTSVQRPGDLMVLDCNPAAQEYSSGSQMLTLNIPRVRLETLLGPTRLYSGLNIGAELGSTTLATRFLNELMRVNHSLRPDVADRMAGIGIDLIAASIAERLAQKVSRPLLETVTVQRAKAYVEAHLGDPDFGPPELAAAVGVSLRRLQELFHERGRHVSDYIWERRLLKAGHQLSTAEHGRLQIGAVAYSCGFSSQAHFSRRFKAHHGVTPSEFRQAALEVVR